MKLSSSTAPITLQHQSSIAPAALACIERQKAHTKRRLLLGLLFSSSIGGLAYSRRSLSRSGVAGAIPTGMATFGFGGTSWGLSLIFFFVSSVFYHTFAPTTRPVPHLISLAKVHSAIWDRLSLMVVWLLLWPAATVWLVRPCYAQRSQLAM